MTEQFQNKKKIDVFCVQKASQLKYSDLLVYCFLCQQARYDIAPSLRRSAEATGQRTKTIKKAKARLQEHGLLGDDHSIVAPCPRMNWFQELEVLRKRFSDGHFSQWFRHWRCYVRQPGPENPLTVPCIVLYSFIRHCVVGGWKPCYGWTAEYLSLVTGINTKTVTSSLKRLEENGFLSVLEGMRFVLYRLRESQLVCFADKRTYSPTASPEPDEFSEKFSPANAVLEEQGAVEECMNETAANVECEEEWTFEETAAFISGHSAFYPERRISPADHLRSPAPTTAVGER